MGVCHARKDAFANRHDRRDTTTLDGTRLGNYPAATLYSP